MRSDIPEPHLGERPTAYADRLGAWYATIVSPEHKKEFGQYLTPEPVADYMAGLCDTQADIIRILDPGSGTGVLTCAVCEHLASIKRRPTELHVVAYENDANLAAVLEKSLAYLKSYLKSPGISLHFDLKTEDLVLAYADALLEDSTNSPSLFQETAGQQSFDLIISNPPYFKISKADPRAKAASTVVHGQPNIYALFMAVGASLLRPGGQLVFITPRSFASGPYFQLFRERFFNKMRPESIHIFESRTDAFKRDDILQENIIMKARRDEGWTAKSAKTHVSISSSNGSKDFHRMGKRQMRLGSILDMGSFDKVFHIPISDDEERILEALQSWAGRLDSYGLQISTGPVVPFRAVPFLAEEGNVPHTHVPLLWMQHVTPMLVTWPLAGQRKPQYFVVIDDSMKLLVADKTYVLLRRFSAKEDRRRLVAGPLFRGQLRSPSIGLENHLNYIHRPGGTLTEDEARGLAVLFNSSVLDTYFRTMNGNTQVSATELRSIPLPDWDLIVRIGRSAKSLPDDEESIDGLIEAFVQIRPNRGSRQAFTNASDLLQEATHGSATVA